MDDEYQRVIVRAVRQEHRAEQGTADEGEFLLRGLHRELMRILIAPSFSNKACVDYAQKGIGGGGFPDRFLAFSFDPPTQDGMTVQQGRDRVAQRKFIELALQVDNQGNVEGFSVPKLFQQPQPLLLYCQRRSRSGSTPAGLLAKRGTLHFWSFLAR